MARSKKDILNSLLQEIASQTVSPRPPIHQQQQQRTPQLQQQRQQFPLAPSFGAPNDISSLLQTLADPSIATAAPSAGGKTPRGIRNNNPGNIRDAGFKWQGMVGTEARSNTNGTQPFVKFESPEFGIRALARDLTTKRNRGLDTIEKIINVYAPPSENLTGEYSKAVSRSLGIPVDKKLDLDHETLVKLVKAVIFHENGMQPYSDEVIRKGVKLSK